ncbi:MAG: hypothetical protein KH706_01465, partial [Faecalibacterium prausnitzii]|nr:hypothetical protein [Faecalibacterium prausnitzii]
RLEPESNASANSAISAYFVFVSWACRPERLLLYHNCGECQALFELFLTEIFHGRKEQKKCRRYGTIALDKKGALHPHREDTT